MRHHLWLPAAAIAALAVNAALPVRSPLLTLLGAAIVVAMALTWGRWSRLAALLALASLALDAGAAIGLGFAARRSAPLQATADRLRLVEARARRLASGLSACAGTVAALPESRKALSGDRSSLTGLFRALDALRETCPNQPALAVRASPLATLAWSGRVGETGALQGMSRDRPGVFVLEETLSTTLIAVAPIRDDAGRALGLSTAETLVAVRRNIQNEFLSDYDLLAAGDPSLTVRYVDFREEADVRPVPGETPLRDAQGRLLAFALATPLNAEQRTRLWATWSRGLMAFLASALVVFCWVPKAVRRRSVASLALAASALRAALLIVPEDSGHAWRLLSPDVYASTALGSLLRTPLDLLLTALWLLCLAGLLLHVALSAPRRAATWVRSLAADLVAIPVLGGVFAALADTTAHCSLDVTAISSLPRSAPHLVVQWSMLVLLAAGAAAMLALFAQSAPFGPGRRQGLARAAQWTGIGIAAYLLWPREILGLPLVPAVALYLMAALLGTTREAWLPGLRAATAGARAGIALVGVGVLTLLLQPSLVHYAEKSMRREIEREHAPSVLRQPEWREYALLESRRRIDGMSLLEDDVGGGPPPLVDELAFAVWASTDLAAFGFSSAVEIQDPTGVVISRFALNLPSLSGSPLPLPAADSWAVTAEPLPLASADRHMLHAQRRLTYHGQLHGAVHLYVSDDFWNLPFITGRDPYSVLYRTASRATARERPVALFAFGWNRETIFSSVDRPPALTPALIDRARIAPFWTTLTLEDRAEHTYLFSDSHGVYGLGYPRVTPGRVAADLVEAVTGMVLSAAAGLLAVVLARTVLRRESLSLPAVAHAVRARFSLRLFVAFIALAVVPVVVLEIVVRGFVTDRLHGESENQALERAAVARKAVEDFAKLQRADAPGRQPVTDAALVWVASLIRSDLDVFERGRLLASSKRELYASGLLSSRVPGNVFRGLAIDGQPAVLGSDRIGGFSYMVVAVPVRLDKDEPGILSIPLASRQREVEAVLADLDRSIRLASILFLAAAAALAHSMARRISEPVRDLTAAAQRIARGDLGARVFTSSRDEFQGLVDSFNQMAGDLDRQRRDLERSNRLAAWAEMARQVAHEVKNPLTPIQLSAEHLRRVYADSGVDFKATLESCTDSILEQVAKLREIVTEFSAFARPPARVLETLDVEELVRTVVRPYAGVLPPGVVLTVERPATPLPLVKAERRLLERAIVNLLENALQAVGDNGRIALTLRADHSTGGVGIEIEDSGPGLDSEARARAFEPFFSTKTGGSGLGLALVRKIAEDHGGGAWIEAAPGKTRATLWLPAEAQRR